MVISLKQFGALYHGSVSQLQPGDLIDHNAAPMSFSTGMPGGHTNANFSTTSWENAAEYAEGNADMATLQTGKKHHPEVYEVEPTTWRSSEWEPDEHSGAGGWYDGPASRQEAFDLADNGSEVSIRHTVPLRVKRTVWAEQNAQDISDTVRGPRSFS